MRVERADGCVAADSGTYAGGDMARGGAGWKVRTARQTEAGAAPTSANAASGTPAAAMNQARLKRSAGLV